MSEILSQSQIDMLMQGIQEGNITEDQAAKDEKKIKKYDFASPKKFTKEKLRNIESLHENLGRVLSSYFSGVLRVFSEVNVMQVEEQRYYEYNNALPDTALMGLLELTPADKNINSSTLMMDISPSIAFFMMDRFLGGGGTGHNLHRDFTEIELAVMTNVFQKITNYMMDVWRDYIEVKIELTSLETNPRLIQIYAPEDIVLIILLNVKLRDMEGTISITIPGIGAEEMMESFTSKYARASTKLLGENREKVSKALIKHSLYESDLCIKATLAQTALELNDILALQENDVIMLDKSATEGVTIKIDNQPWFGGRLGNVKSNRAVRVTDLCAQNWNKEEYLNGE